MIETASELTPRADTATSVELADSRLLVVYQKYRAGRKSGHDEGYCNIWSKSSGDGVRAWHNPRLLVDVAQGDVNVMNPMLLKLAPREVLLICHRNHPPKPSTSTAVVFRSTDGGKTFSELAKAWERPPTYRVAIPPLNRLTSGRILLAFAAGKDNQHFHSTTTYSDDGGRTWIESDHQIKLPKRGALEPSVTQLNNGTLLMSIRTQLGRPVVDGYSTLSLTESVQSHHIPKAQASVTKDLVSRFADECSQIADRIGNRLGFIGLRVL